MTRDTDRSPQGGNAVGGAVRSTRAGADRHRPESGTQPPENAELAVTQADRDAAITLIDGAFGPCNYSHEVRQGLHDCDPTVQAFARHRLASLSSPVLPGVREALTARIHDQEHDLAGYERGADQVIRLKRQRRELAKIAREALALLPSETPNHG